MPFDGNGNWTSNFNAEADRDAGYKILASRFDNILLADIAQSFENCLTKDTQIKPQTNFNANNYRIINVADPENDHDALTYGKFRTGNNTITGNNTFSTSFGLRTRNPIILKEGDNSVEGGQIEFESGDTEPNAGKKIYLDRYSGSLRIYGVRSDDTTVQLFMADVQNDKITLSANAQINLNSKVMPNYSAAFALPNSGYYVATSNGYVFMTLVGSPGGETHAYINSIDVAIGWYTNTGVGQRTCIPMNKGDTINWDTGRMSGAVFVPCVGG